MRKLTALTESEDKWTDLAEMQEKDGTWWRDNGLTTNEERRREKEPIDNRQTEKYDRNLRRAIDKKVPGKGDGGQDITNLRTKQSRTPAEEKRGPAAWRNGKAPNSLNKQRRDFQLNHYI